MTSHYGGTYVKFGKGAVSQSLSGTTDIDYKYGVEKSSLMVNLFCAVGYSRRALSVNRAVTR